MDVQSLKTSQKGLSQHRMKKEFVVLCLDQKNSILEDSVRMARPSIEQQGTFPLRFNNSACGDMRRHQLFS